MEIYQKSFFWPFLLCIIFLFVFIIFEKNKSKNLKNEITSLENDLKKIQTHVSMQIQEISTSKNDLLLEKIAIDKTQRIVNSERIIFEETLKNSLEQLHSLSIETQNKNSNNIYYNYKLYPELEFFIMNFSAKKIANSIINIADNTLYKDFRQNKIKSELDISGVYSPTIHGYIYAMYNLSLPGVVKIGCSDAPNIRAKELTAGEDFRSNTEYAQHKRKFDNYCIGKTYNDDNPLRDYVQTLNLKLKTSLPSPFIVAFFFESFEAYNDECLLHFALKDYNVYRGAGTEYFALTLRQVHEVFKSIFPHRAYQYPNFAPHKN